VLNGSAEGLEVPWDGADKVLAIIVKKTFLFNLLGIFYTIMTCHPHPPFLKRHQRLYLFFLFVHRKAAENSRRLRAIAAKSL